MSVRKPPKFKTEAEEARFWSAHDSVDYWGASPEDPQPLRLAAELEHSIDARAKQKKLISLRLEQWQLRLAKSIAARQDIPYHAVLRNWITAGIRTTLRKAR